MRWLNTFVFQYQEKPLEAFLFALKALTFLHQMEVMGKTMSRKEIPDNAIEIVAKHINARRHKPYQIPDL